MTMKLVDLFCGAGGLSCGLELAGFSTILGIESHPKYAETYKANHPATEVITQDIRDIPTTRIFELTGLKRGELDLLAGGPPCQGFSINAPIRSLDDQRNHLFREFMRIAGALFPKAILIENVPGIISLGGGAVVDQIYKELTNLGYIVKHKILFAGHYGVPQIRFRTVFIAIRDTNNIYFPEPTHNCDAIANFAGSKELCQKLSPLFSSKLIKKTTVWDAISDLPPLKPGESIHDKPYETNPLSFFQETLRTKSTVIFNHSCAKLGTENLKRLKYIPQGGSWRDIPIDLLPAGLKRARRSDHTKRYGRLHPDSLCSTILTKCDPHWGSFFHPYQDRAISVREAARIQSFPDQYVFTGTLTQQYEQVGNAVPPFLAKAIGNKIAEQISQEESHGKNFKKFG